MRRTKSVDNPKYASYVTVITFGDPKKDEALRRSCGNSILTIGYDSMPPFYKLEQDAELPLAFYPFAKVPSSGHVFEAGVPFFANNDTSYLDNCLALYGRNRQYTFGVDFTAPLLEP
ncbi:hypothetical protein MRX96_040031 [Rhipicephalus microplus]